MDKKINDEKFNKALEDLQSEDINKKIEAISILGFSEKLEAIKPLKNIYQNGGNIVKSYARTALKRLEDSLKLDREELIKKVENLEKSKKSKINLTKLRELINDNDPKIRIGGIQAASELNCTDALPFLRERLENEYHLFAIASLLISIGKLGGEKELDIIYPFLTHNDERIRANSVEAINYINSPKTDIQRLIPLLGDSSTRVVDSVKKVLSKNDVEKLKKEYENKKNITSHNDPSRLAKEAIEYEKIIQKKKKKPEIKKIIKIEEKKYPVWLYIILLLIIFGIPASYYLIFVKNNKVVNITNSIQKKTVTKVKINSNDKLLKELKIINSYLNKNRIELAEIALGKLLQKYGHRSIISLYFSDIYIRKKDYMSALKEIKKVKNSDKIKSKLLFFKAKIEYGFKNYTDSLSYLTKLKKLKRDKYTISGIKLEKTIRREIDEINKKMISGVKKRLKNYYSLINENKINKTLTFFLEKKEFKKNLFHLILIYAKSKKIYVTPISENIEIKFKRGDTRVTSTILEMNNIISRGNIPEIKFEYKTIDFNMDEPPLITNMDIIETTNDKYKPLINLAIVNSSNKISLDDKIKILEKLHTRNKENGYIIFSLSKLYSSLGFNNKIIKLLEGKIKKLKYTPAFYFGNNYINSQLYDILANSYFDKNNEKKYIKYLKKGLVLNNLNGKIILELMIYELKNKNIINYKSYYSLLMVAEPDYRAFDKIFFPELYSSIIKVENMIKNENFKDSMELLTKLKQKNLNYWRITDLMGDIFYKLERYNQSIMMYEESLKNNPYNNEIMRKLALSFYYNEEYEDSEKYIKMARKLGDSKKIRKSYKIIMKAKNQK